MIVNYLNIYLHGIILILDVKGLTDVKYHFEDTVVAGTLHYNLLLKKFRLLRPVLEIRKIRKGIRWRWRWSTVIISGWLPL